MKTKKDIMSIMDGIIDVLADGKIYITDAGVDHKGFCYFSIQWGDWKHDHLSADYIVDKYLDTIGYRRAAVIERIDEEDGSDCYSATHIFRVVEK